MGGSEEARPVACLTQDGSEKRGRRPLPLAARHVKHAQAILRIAEPFEQSAYAVQFEIVRVRNALLVVDGAQPEIERFLVRQIGVLTHARTAPLPCLPSAVVGERGGSVLYQGEAQHGRLVEGNRAVS